MYIWQNIEKNKDCYVVLAGNAIDDLKKNI
jgi:hypothetical protein